MYFKTESAIINEVKVLKPQNTSMLSSLSKIKQITADIASKQDKTDYLRKGREGDMWDEII